MYYLVVKPANRGGGVGRRLMQEAESWLRERDVVKLNLMVRHSNAEALSFYQQLGYVDAEVTVLARSDQVFGDARDGEHEPRVALDRTVADPVSEGVPAP